DKFFAVSEPANSLKSSQTQRPSSPAPSLRSILSTPSPVLIPTSGVIELSLNDFCSYVDEFTSLKEASIVSVEGYRQQRGPITHRFVVLQLSREIQDNIWLRLDRRLERGVSLLKFLKASGETRANDSASLSGTKHRLIAGATRENARILEHPPSLANLNRLLRIIREELQTYSIWPENCWFFCSLVEQHLAAAESGWFVHGTRNVRHIGMGNAIRSNVFARYWDGNYPMTRIKKSSTTVAQRGPQSTVPITSASGDTHHSSDTIGPSPPILLENAISTPTSLSSAAIEPTISTPIATSSLGAQQATASLALVSPLSPRPPTHPLQSTIPNEGTDISIAEEVDDQLVGLSLLRTLDAVWNVRPIPAETQKTLALAQDDAQKIYPPHSSDPLQRTIPSESQKHLFVRHSVPICRFCISRRTAGSWLYHAEGYAYYRAQYYSKAIRAD
ncbi:hypothetical protein DL93DRAFT_2174102, partial [Clavulina sp. PMI_390]